MLLSHAVLLAEARSYVAALADAADGFDASLAYEQLLLQLDWLHDGIVPPITVVPAGDPNVLRESAARAITELAHHRIDPLDLAICREMLEGVWRLDHPGQDPRRRS